MRSSKKSQRFLIHNVKLEWEEPFDLLCEKSAQKLGVPAEAIKHLELVRKSVDARRRPRFVCSVVVDVEHSKSISMKGDVQPPKASIYFTPKKYSLRDFSERVVVIGAGPAGLFCAHRLADAGLKPILLDRGKPVERRGKDVSKLMHTGVLLNDSNICFGEGGAGTWSDGKLYTRVGDPRVRHVLKTIVALGGPESILTDGKPHLGTNRLVALCKAFRQQLLHEGCQVHFDSFVRRLNYTDRHGRRTITGVTLADGTIIDADRVVLAVGHSARELYRVLAEDEVGMAPKAFAVGYRVEHPQALINEIQYREWVDLPNLPTADYRISTNFGQGDAHRGVYSFCMCPGGQIVPASSQPGGVCINGMSHASRRGFFANSALVVSIKPQDFGSFGPLPGLGDFGGVLDGVIFQREAERRAFELGGGDYFAPAQRLADFFKGVSSQEIAQSTYKPGIRTTDIDSCYPEWVISHLKRGLVDFEHQMPGFLTNDASLLAVETRTSAPLTVLRDTESLQSTNVDYLYPCGEGSGYAGGIVSAAIDGLRVAEQILEELS